MDTDEGLAEMTYEEIVNTYWVSVRRAVLSWNTRSERLRKQGSHRRYRVMMRRSGFPNAIGC